MDKYKIFTFIGIIVIALGATITTTMKDTIGLLGIVFIALGKL